MPYKVLIADDEKNIVDLLQEIALQLGLEVVTAFDGRQALNVFEEHKPDFVLMDISMPVSLNSNQMKRRSTESLYEGHFIQILCQGVFINRTYSHFS